MSYALVLLCGGLSTRMGTNKAFLPFGEYTLMEYQVRRFRPNFEKIYLSVPKMTDFWMQLAARLDCTAIPDCVEKIGPLGGLYSCLSAVTEELLFFTPVDAPFTGTNAALAVCRTLAQAIVFCVYHVFDDREAGFCIGCGKGLHSAGRMFQDAGIF